MSKIQKGFTLIELLVVIAIIGILAGILFVAIDPSSKVNDAKDAQVTASLAGIPSAAQLVYTANDAYSYAAVCANTGVAQTVTATGATCANTAGGYTVHKALNNGTDMYCVDGTGFAGKVTGAVAVASAGNCK